MILDEILPVTALVAAFAAIANIVGASAYDVRQVKQRRQQMLHPHARRYKRRPVVSVLVVTQNSETSIYGCLQSLAASSYRKLEIVVADNASTDGTKRLVRQFMAATPNRQVKLYAKRRNEDPLKALEYAYKQYVRGELVMPLGGSYELDKRAVALAVDHFNRQEIDCLNLNRKTRASFTASGLFQNFGLLLRNRGKKASCVLGTDYFNDTLGAKLYSSRAFSELARLKWPLTPILSMGDKRLRMGYASDAVVFGPTQSFSGLINDYYNQFFGRLRALFAARGLFFRSEQDYSIGLTWVKLPLTVLFSLAALTVPLLLTYFAYLAVSLHQPAFLLSSWMALGVFLAFTIWEDEQLNIRQKAKYLFLMPITYGWFYVLSFIQYVVVLTSFRRLKTPTL